MPNLINELEALDEKIEKIKERKIQLKSEKERLKEEQATILEEFEEAGITVDNVYEELNQIRHKIQEDIKKVHIPEELLND